MRIAALVIVLGCGSGEPTPGVLHGGIERDGDMTVASFKGVAVDVTDIPLVASAFGDLPVKGKADVTIDVKAPAKDARQAQGTIEVTCRACTIGGGTIKPKPRSTRSQVFASEGLHVGELAISLLDVRISIADGVATIDRWKLDSPDIELVVSGKVDLRKKLDDSIASLCIKYRGAPDLQKRDPKLWSVLMITGAERGDDGYLQIGVRGTLGTPRMHSRCN